MNPARLLEHFDRIAEAPDAIPRLRRFILDLAVRGKLVEQDPNDEPASELLKRIRAEKMRLVKAGKLKLPKPLSLHVLDNLPYDIPRTWAHVPFGETIDAHYGGGTPSKNNSLYWDGDIYWASVKDVGKSKYINTTIDRITEAGLENSSSNLIPPGNLIVVTRMGLGKVSINRVPVSINQDLRALIPSTLVSIDYQYIFFKTHGFEGTGLTVKGIKVDELLNVAFPLPPLAEQHRIVVKVDELMALCDRLEATQAKRESRRDRLASASLKRISQPEDVGNGEEFRENVRFHLDHLPRLTTRLEHIKELRQAILNLAVRGKLVPQDPNDEPAAELLKSLRSEKDKLIKAKTIRAERPLASVARSGEPFSLPQSWRWERIGTLAIAVDYGTSVQSNASDEGIPVLKMGDIQDGKVVLGFHKKVPINTEGLPQLYLDTLDLLYNRTNSAELVGKTGVFLGPEKAYTFASYLIRVRFDPNHISPVYANLAMNAPYFRETQIIPELKQQCGQANVNGTKLRNMLIPVPPLAEQYRIVAKVNELMALCDHLEAQINSSQADRSRLLEATLREALGISNMPALGASRTASPRATPAPRQAEIPLQAAKPRLVEPAHTAPQSSIADQPKPALDSRSQSAPEAILAQMKPGHDYSRAQLCDVLGLSVYEWNMAIRALKDNGTVIQTGEKRGARYRLSNMEA